MAMMMGVIVLTSFAAKANNNPPSPSDPLPFSHSSISKNHLQPSIFDGLFSKFKKLGFVLCVYNNCLGTRSCGVCFARCEEECALKHLY